MKNIKVSYIKDDKLYLIELPGEYYIEADYFSAKFVIETLVDYGAYHKNYYKSDEPQLPL